MLLLKQTESIFCTDALSVASMKIMMIFWKLPLELAKSQSINATARLVVCMYVNILLYKRKEIKYNLLVVASAARFYSCARAKPRAWTSTMQLLSHQYQKNVRVRIWVHHEEIKRWVWITKCGSFANVNKCSFRSSHQCCSTCHWTSAWAQREPVASPVVILFNDIHL